MFDGCWKRRPDGRVRALLSPEVRGAGGVAAELIRPLFRIGIKYDSTVNPLPTIEAFVKTYQCAFSFLSVLFE